MAIVADVSADHNIAIIAHGRFRPTLYGSSMNRCVLTDDTVFTNGQGCGFPLIVNALRRKAKDRKREYFRMSPNRCVPLNDRMGMNLNVIFENNVGSYNSISAYAHPL